VIDGKLDDWAGVTTGEILLDGKHLADFRMVFDGANLYIAWDVKRPGGLRNAGTELPLCPFVSGDYVDFCVGRDWSNPDRGESLEGDLRVILARITGDPPTDYQMAFRPVWKDGRNPQTITSPAATRKFADVSPVQGLQFAYTVTDGGYTLEAQVPLKSIALDPRRNSVIGFDTSIGIADAAGRVRTQTVHWAGQTETAVVDRPGSAALRPPTWGTVTFDRTPLK